MNSTTSDAGQPSSSDSQKLSRFHPRTSTKTDGEEGFPPGGNDAKSKEGWVHTPTGLRPARRFSSTVKTPVAAIPKVVVPDSSQGPSTTAKVTSQPPAAIASVASEDLQTAATRHEPIFARIRKETSLFLKAALALAFLIGLVLSFQFGRSTGRKSALRVIQPADESALRTKEFPETAWSDLDTALGLLRKGNNLEALQDLQTLLDSYPDAPSLHYAMAIAALQSGYPREADRMADASIKHGFRVSDSLALKAAVLAAQSKGPSGEQETLLKRAIAADPMNPNPLLELATLYRYQKQPDRARSTLDSAALRLNPADARMVLDTTLAILNVDQAGELPEPAQPLGIPSRDFPNAYAEMKRGNFQNAAAILKFCSGFIDADLFAYLINDPALRKFASKPELSGFY